jgi:hypothetical protein
MEVMRRKGIRSVLAFALMAFALTVTQVATAGRVASRGSKPLALGLRWTVLAQHDTGFSYDSRYGFAYIGENGAGAGLLIDDRVGRDSEPRSCKASTPRQCSTSVLPRS